VLTSFLATALALGLVAWTVRGATSAGRVTAAGPPPAATPVIVGPDASPLANADLFVTPGGPAVEQVRTWQAQGRTADADIVKRIADRPAALWFLTDERGFAARAKEHVRQAAAVGKLPVLVAAYVPGHDCHDSPADDRAGAKDATAYHGWVDALADAIGDEPAVVVLEPNGVAQAVSGCLPSGKAVTERYAMLAQAVESLTAAPRAKVYLGAGNPAWVADVDTLAAGLKKAGVEKADGFALNVSGFETTPANLSYGRALSDRLGAAHFVVDTSRNGNGPYQQWNGDEHWCNPPGRALGEAPTTRTGQPRVDAYLWVKRPGESDGACGNGAPPSGTWWPQYALDLARTAT
jgi:endoglucanase